MIQYMCNGMEMKLLAFGGVFFAFLLTCIFLKTMSGFLPKDLGRDFAHDGKKSAGKPRGAGFIFILVFAVSTILFGKMGNEVIIYVILTLAAMLTGFLDDCARTPWGELKKGLLDFAIAIMVAITFLNFNSSTIYLIFTKSEVTLNPILFGVLAVILVWVSINVTNCSDGVDGLSGTITVITLSSIYAFDTIRKIDSDFRFIILLFIVCILGYLWFNATPSKMMMGDAGSRAMGLFISIAILKTNSPFLYLLFALVLIIDGGLGLIKVSLLRFLKIRILTNVRTPIHDHVRKVKGWSNTQTVFRFAIIQIMISMAVLFLV
ncbi:MraY family glycosyltransferase [Velocimicrobium porci]|uniref:Phospho-N-acetylmuramoyl-pentapeptide-transferase n=1 Tax=Velocimicrobium porci TaxID=2606634 RepID=A0A6L5XWL0_9FIRM|nr:phospho-N-acetylmuramoyl-pentapeptide-transferase [Velocimicrobium porci]MSS63216.1 phospho-N-acetylmuramoyl-pentapeptide-transferase [Velocimicrobium porci]